MSEQLEGGQVKGGMLQSHFDWATKELGAESLEKIRQRLSPEMQELVARPVLATKLYPFRLLIEVDKAIAALRGGRADEVYKELGRHSARINLGSVYQVFNKSAPHDFFERAAQLHSRFQDWGRAVYEKLGPMTCRLSLFEYRTHSKVFCSSGIGYYEEATKLQGGHLPKVVETTCTCDGSDACRFEISWS